MSKTVTFGKSICRSVDDALGGYRSPLHKKKIPKTPKERIDILAKEIEEEMIGNADIDERSCQIYCFAQIEALKRYLNEANFTKQEKK